MHLFVIHDNIPTDVVFVTKHSARPMGFLFLFERPLSCNKSRFFFVISRSEKEDARQQLHVQK